MTVQLDAKIKYGCQEQCTWHNEVKMSTKTPSKFQIGNLVRINHPLKDYHRNGKVFTIESVETDNSFACLSFYKMVGPSNNYLREDWLEFATDLKIGDHVAVYIANGVKPHIVRVCEYPYRTIPPSKAIWEPFVYVFDGDTNYYEKTSCLSLVDSETSLTYSETPAEQYEKRQKLDLETQLLTLRAENDINLRKISDLQTIRDFDVSKITELSQENKDLKQKNYKLQVEILARELGAQVRDRQILNVGVAIRDLQSQLKKPLTSRLKDLIFAFSEKFSSLVKTNNVQKLTKGYLRLRSKINEIELHNAMSLAIFSMLFPMFSITYVDYIWYRVERNNAAIVGPAHIPSPDDPREAALLEKRAAQTLIKAKKDWK